MAWIRIGIVLLLMTATAAAREPGVNAVVGDASWVARFGVLPDASVDEDLRIRVHLEYVEALLRASEPVGASDAQRAARAHNLDLLHAYLERGVFPRNHVVPGRRPHFIDEDGRICAVGYLIEQTAGRDVAETINARHEWDYIEDIDGIEGWVAASGLTVHELAMIQPGYSWLHPIEPAPRPPPPLLVDEGEQQRRMVLAALRQATGDVQACADRAGVWGSIEVEVTMRRFAVEAFAPRVGNRRLRGCVRRVVDRAVAGHYFRQRVTPLTLRYTFVLDDRDDGFAKPPPR